MKTILSILFLSALGSYQAGAQTATSSQRNAQTQTVPEAATSASGNGATATLVSGEKNATTKEVPLENKDANGTAIPVTPLTTSSSKQPD